MSDLVRAAARNNAEWCDIMCRLHGVAGRFHDDAWTVPRRSPPFYPDAVTLAPTATAETVLAETDTTPGCSVKDSFACLDLVSAGFHLLFDAQWISRPSGEPLEAGEKDLRWEPVRDPVALEAWERAWNEGDEPIGLFAAALVEDDAVLVLCGYRGDDVVAGAVANRSASVVGVSNVFSVTGNLDPAWRGCLAGLAEYVPDLPVVGYEEGDALVAACRCGFSAIGPLRVWIKESGPVA